MSSTEIYAVTAWDADGSDPQPELTVVGGTFHYAGRHVVNNIAAYDGHRWMPLGDGVAMTAEKPIVRAIVVHDGQLIAAGRFTTAGAAAVQYIARWDGAQWHPLGEGLPAECAALISYGGELFAAGFGWQTTPGFIRRWNGAQWIASEGGLPLVSTFANFQGSLLAASHDGIFRWTGSGWQMFASFGSDYAQINTMVEFDGDLVVGGSFGALAGVQARNIARWNGQTWQAIGSGFYDGPQDMAAVRTCLVSQGRLYAAGSITLPFFPEQAGVTEWTGTEWLPVGNAFAIDVFVSGIRSGRPFFGGSLVVGECCGFDAGGGAIQQWDSVVGKWHGFLDVHPPHLLQTTSFDGDLYAIGKEPSDGPLIQSTIYRFHNGIWQIIARAAGLPHYNRFNRLLVMDARLYVAGRFSNLGGVPAKCVASWDGQAWSQVGAGFGEQYAEVADLAEFEGKLIAGGHFETAGGTGIRAIAAWDGATWQSLGGGLTGFQPDDSSVQVSRMLRHDGALIVAGWFVNAGGTPVTSLARWDGNHWSAFGDPLTANGGSSPSVWDIIMYHNHVVAAGYFETAGGQVVNNVAEWTGSAWAALGTGITEGIDDEGLNPQGSTLAVLGDVLYLGGPFLRAGNVVSNCIAKWDGSAWSPMGSPPGVSPECNGCLRMVTNLEVQYDELLVEGYFLEVNGMLSYQSAYWAPTVAAPEIVEGPQTTAICPNQPAALSVSATSATQPAYQWRHNLVPLTDNGTYAGANGPVLSITAVNSETTGVYDCVVSVECNIVVTAPASVIIAAFGGADGNGDGRVDGRDVEAMVRGIISDTTGPSGCRLDMNFDGAVSPADVPHFISRLLSQ